ncbi:MAG: methylmalonyl-CoA epimerase [bacterium]|nr:methylmalonyl-CoA epimerase [bacterium]MDT8365669.1 methylmalonyl-CoA epimerase [bacterium]
MKKPKLDHIGIAVEDLEASIEVYRNLGFEVESVDDVPGFGVKVGFLPMETGSVELVQPVKEDSAMAKFLEKKGGGIHHLCFEVYDIRAELKRLEAAGVELVDKVPRHGAHGTLVAFLHPKSTGGVLIELAQKG